MERNKPLFSMDQITSALDAVRHFGEMRKKQKTIYNLS